MNDNNSITFVFITILTIILASIQVSYLDVINGYPFIPLVSVAMVMITSGNK